MPVGRDEHKFLIQQLLDRQKRESVLIELSKVRESIPDIGNRLWNEPGTLSGSVFLL